MDHEIKSPEISKTHQVSTRIIIVTILFFAWIFTVTTGFTLGRAYQQKIYTQTELAKTQKIAPDIAQHIAYNQAEPQKHCPHYEADARPDSVFAQYTVKPNDTLLSISNKQLGNTYQAESIAVLNRHLYPSLSLDHPFLETGWVLSLPPVNMPSFVGTPYIGYGEIVNFGDSPDQWLVYDGRSKHDLHLSAETLFQGKTDFQIGDCIIFMIDRSYLAPTLFIMSQ